ncbi:MAG: hypothetical protein IPK67_06910 [Planctomycetes bacterium]|nr:hypothetical protein [Planctomycetota bacterium]
MRRRSSATSSRAGAPADAARKLLERLLGARSRDRSPGARELVAFRPGDDPAYLALLARSAERLEALSRFGRPLGSVAVFPPWSAARPEREQAEEFLLRRWRGARPIVLRGWASSLLKDRSGSLAKLERTLSKLRRPGTLGRLLAEMGIEAEAVAALDDPERDLEKFRLPGPEGLWIKSATLTSPASNESGRIRFSFGAEGDDDASSDEARHRAVARLARRALPVADALARSRRHLRRLERLCGGPVLLTQHIAYWNAPQGGALLHHDSFAEPARTRQRGVCYVQLSGATLWLALSSADLARHVRAVLAALARGEAPWIAEEHFDGPRALKRLQVRARDSAWLGAQLASSGCGEFARLVNYSPEFLGLALDAGHGALLAPGDAILLPNHGLSRTCLHAVWCAGNAPGAALSMAIRRSPLGRPRAKLPAHREQP